MIRMGINLLLEWYVCRGKPYVYCLRTYATPCVKTCSAF